MKSVIVTILLMLYLPSFADSLPVVKEGNSIIVSGDTIRKDLDDGYKVRIDEDFYHITHADLKAALATYCKTSQGVNKCR